MDDDGLYARLKPIVCSYGEPERACALVMPSPP